MNSFVREENWSCISNFALMCHVSDLKVYPVWVKACVCVHACVKCEERHLFLSSCVKNCYLSSLFLLSSFISSFFTSGTQTSHLNALYTVFLPVCVYCAQVNCCCLQPSALCKAHGQQWLSHTNTEGFLWVQSVCVKECSAHDRPAVRSLPLIFCLYPLIVE